ncbi:Alpha/beta hydrolase family protein [compost metagenome]
MAVHLASQNKVDKLVLETPYTSLTEVASESYPFLPTAILKYKMPTKEWIKDVQVPILILHGTKDEVIPFHHAQTLAPLNPNIQ